SAGVAYATSAAFARAAGTGSAARMFRIATDAEDMAERARIIRALEDELGAAGAAVEAVIPFSELRTAIGDHVLILMRALMAMAAIMAVVGLLGLGSAMGVSVVERTREIAVMKTVGATPERVTVRIVEEALFIAGSSWILAVLLSMPLSWLIDHLIGQL